MPVIDRIDRIFGAGGRVIFNGRPLSWRRALPQIFDFARESRSDARRWRRNGVTVGPGRVGGGLRPVGGGRTAIARGPTALERPAGAGARVRRRVFLGRGLLRPSPGAQPAVLGAPAATLTAPGGRSRPPAIKVGEEEVAILRGLFRPSDLFDLFRLCFFFLENFFTVRRVLRFLFFSSLFL
jgi:hypothetical protein